jgi:hypothetical protein
MLINQFRDNLRRLFNIKTDGSINVNAHCDGISVHLVEHNLLEIRILLNTKHGIVNDRWLKLMLIGLIRGLKLDSGGKVKL